MSSWMSNLRAFGGAKRSNTSNNPNQPPSRSNTGSPSSNAPSLPPPSYYGVPASPNASNTMISNEYAHQTNQYQSPPGRTPLFFKEAYSGFIVKGNFMTLAAKPVMVEEGEWLAHQLVEQIRLLGGMLKIVQEPCKTTRLPTCSERSCPTMSAGPTTYTWISTEGKPINLPAHKYISHIQTWVNGKIMDPALFPTDNFTTAPPMPTPNTTTPGQPADPNHWLGRTSGFPQRFDTEIRNMYKQMLRCYAHLYWSHWLNFWELGASRELNTCFVHFVNVGRIFGLLGERDMEPMGPLVELWIGQGVLPKKSEGTPTSTTASSAGGAGGNGLGSGIAGGENNVAAATG